MKTKTNKPSQREFYSLKNAHKIPCLGRYKAKGVSAMQSNIDLMKGELKA
jgi:hypothetical protein